MGIISTYSIWLLAQMCHIVGIQHICNKGRRECANYCRTMVLWLYKIKMEALFGLYISSRCWEKSQEQHDEGEVHGEERLCLKNESSIDERMRKESFARWPTWVRAWAHHGPGTRGGWRERKMMLRKSRKYSWMDGEGPTQERLDPVIALGFPFSVREHFEMHHL